MPPLEGVAVDIVVLARNNHAAAGRLQVGAAADGESGAEITVTGEEGGTPGEITRIIIPVPDAAAALWGHLAMLRNVGSEYRPAVKQRGDQRSARGIIARRRGNDNVRLGQCAFTLGGGDDFD